MIPMYIGYDYTAYLDYMGHDAHCPKKSLTHSRYIVAIYNIVPTAPQ